MSLQQLFFFGLLGLGGAGLVWLISAVAAANARAGAGRSIMLDGGGPVLTTADLTRLRHRNEVSRLLLALLVVIPLSLLFAVYAAFTLGLIVVFIYLFVLLVRNVLHAGFLGNMLRVDDHNFPEILRWSEEVRTRIGYPKPIDIFIYEEGSFNALLVPFLKRRAILLNSELAANTTEGELKWIIGRFVGYLRGKKSRLMIFEIFLNSIENLIVFNLLLYPYERAAVLTGDRIGAYAVDNNRAAIFGAMKKMFAGSELASRVDDRGLYAQHRELQDKAFFSVLARLGSPFPHMTRRYAEMHEFLNAAESRGFGGPSPGAAVPVPEVSAAPAKLVIPGYRETATDRTISIPKPDDTRSGFARAPASAIAGTAPSPRGFAFLLLGLLVLVAGFGAVPVVVWQNPSLAFSAFNFSLFAQPDYLRSEPLRAGAEWFLTTGAFLAARWVAGRRSVAVWGLVIFGLVSLALIAAGQANFYGPVIVSAGPMYLTTGAAISGFVGLCFYGSAAMAASILPGPSIERR